MMGHHLCGGFLWMNNKSCSLVRSCWWDTTSLSLALSLYLPLWPTRVCMNGLLFKYLLLYGTFMVIINKMSLITYPCPSPIIIHGNNNKNLRTQFCICGCGLWPSVSIYNAKIIHLVGWGSNCIFQRMIHLSLHESAVGSCNNHCRWINEGICSAWDLCQVPSNGWPRERRLTIFLNERYSPNPD